MSRADLDLDELERLAQEATPGPWQPFGAYVEGAPASERLASCVSRSRSAYQDCTDASFIAAANPETVLALIARVRELTEQRAALATRMSWEQNMCYPGDPRRGAPPPPNLPSGWHRWVTDEHRCRVNPETTK